MPFIQPAPEKLSQFNSDMAQLRQEKIAKIRPFCSSQKELDESIARFDCFVADGRKQLLEGFQDDDEVFEADILETFEEKRDWINTQD